MPHVPPTLWFDSGQAIRQGLPDIEGATPRKDMAETPADEPIRLAIIRVDEMKPIERERLTDVELMREALTALEGQVKDGHTQSCLGRCGHRCSARCQRIRAAIAKLEERLLKE